MAWQALPNLVYGKVVEPFLPLEGLPEAALRRKLSKSFRNVYSGDQVYLFECQGSNSLADSQWARGYVISQPIPSDFSSATSNLEQLPERRISISVLPVSCVQPIEEMALPNAAVKSNLEDNTEVTTNNGTNAAIHSMILDDSLTDSNFANDGFSSVSESSFDDEETSATENDQVFDKPGRPSLPVNESLDSKNLYQEIDLVLKNLSAVIFALYAQNDFSFFGKLVTIYHELDDIRLNLSHNLLTKFEEELARRNAVLLFNRIAKLLASSGGKINRASVPATPDVKGNQSVLSRDPITAELYSFSDDSPETLSTMENPANIAQNQVLGALSPHYPLRDSNISFTPEKNQSFELLTPSNILIDFKEVSGSSALIPTGYAGMTAYMYLRNSKKQLTQAFSITINPDQQIFLDNLSAALFTNITTPDIESGKIYLVALLTERINIEDAQPPMTQVRKGICAGVADISRVFSRRKGHLESGEAHRFTIKLFSSYTSKSKAIDPNQLLHPGMNQKMAMSLTIANSGWGELIERIIAGSDRGVAVNPRAERIILSIKELRDERSEDLDDVESDGTSLRRVQTSGSFNEKTASALATVRTLRYNTLEKPSELVYLRVLKFGDLGVQLGDRTYLTVIVRGSSPRLRFAGGSNEPPKASWQFLSIAPGEALNEIVQITGLNRETDSKQDLLYFDIYADSKPLGRAEYLLREGKKIYNTGLFVKKGQAQVDIVSGTAGVGQLKFELDYVGTTCNVDDTAETIIDWRNLFPDPTTPDLMDALVKFKHCQAPTLTMFFSSLMYELLAIFATGVHRNMKELQTAAFEGIVRTLDVTVARHRDNVALFDQFMTTNIDTLPSVGEQLLGQMSSYFSAFETDWNSVGRALCRVSVPLLRLSRACIHQPADFVTQGYRLVNSTTAFLSSNKEVLVADQLLVIDALELYLDDLQGSFQISELATFAAGWVNAGGVRGLGMFEDPTATALTNKKRKREHQLMIKKLLFVNRLVSGFLLESGAQSPLEMLLVNALRLMFRVLDNSVIDIDCSRLALGIILAITTGSYGRNRRFVDKTGTLYLTLVRGLPKLCALFNKYTDYCNDNELLKPKRSFTQLFPNEYPFTEYTMDSIVSDVSLAEVLVEFTIVIAFISKICRGFDEDVQKYLKDPSQFEGNMSNYISLNEFLGPAGIALRTNEDLTSYVRALRRQMTPNYYPGSKWISIKAVNLHATALNLELAAPSMEALIPEFDKVLWTGYMSTFMRCCTDKTISVEHLADIPRKGCLKLTGDLRAHIAETIGSLWDKIGDQANTQDLARFQIERFGGHQTELVSHKGYGILEDLFLLSMQRNAKCLEVGTHIFWSIIASEIVGNDDLFVLEQECVSALYDMFHRVGGYSPAALEIRHFELSLLNMTKNLDNEDVAYGMVNKFIDTISSYLDTLAGLQSIPEGEEFDDDRTFYKIKISGYLLDVDRPELFQSFVDDMYQSNLNKGNFVQAALSMQLLADTYDWNNNVYLPACVSPQLPSQTEFKRKVQLYAIIAQNFSKGSRPEQAVEVYQEMLSAYEKQNFDLEGLAQCHSELSRLYMALQEVDRLESTFFKISFIGFGFPVAIRGKEFIYEGLPYEHITSINHRLIRLYPGSRIISNDDEAKRLLTETPFGKYLHIKTIKPKRAPLEVGLSYMAQQYVDNRGRNTFVSSRRLPGATAITNLWTEESTYETYMTFPTLMNRSEIEKSVTLKLSPVKNAIRSLVSKNDELSNLEYLIHQNLRDNISLPSIASSSMFNTLSRILAGTVDSPVNGGMGQYRVFFDQEKLAENAETCQETVEEYGQDSQELHDCFNELVRLLSRLLKLHQLICPESLQPQHDAMSELFQENFAPEIADLKLDVSTPLDYDNLMVSLTSTNVHSRHRQTFTVQSPAASIHVRTSKHHHRRGHASSTIRGSTAGDSASLGASTLGRHYVPSLSNGGDDRSSYTAMADDSFVSHNSKRTILNYR